jgi:tetratricopeptide (TPR) repeat protein
LERIFPDRISELAPALGYHFERAELPDQAFRYLKLAGEHAQSVFANIEAANYFQAAASQAEAILRTGEDKEVTSSLAELKQALGDVLRLLGQNEEARVAYRASLNLLPNDAAVKRSILQRKIGSAYTVDRDYQAMTDAFDAADQELGLQPAEPVAEWWSEKMQILLERLHLLYWQGMSNEMSELAEKYSPEIEKRGTPVQRGRFFQMLGLSELTRARYVASDRAVELTELAVSTSGDAPNPAEIGHLRFTAGLTNLFRGNLQKAVEHFQAGLNLAERAGDLVMQTRCLAYLAVATRRAHDPDRCERFASRAAALAGQLGMPEYVAMATANLAWLAWHEGKYPDANSLGTEALTLWHGMSDPYGVDWEAILPLVGAALAERRLDDAIEHARGLFRENQHPIPPVLAAAARDAIEGAKTKTSTEKQASLERMIEVARDIGYL